VARRGQAPKRLATGSLSGACAQLAMCLGPVAAPGPVGEIGRCQWELCRAKLLQLGARQQKALRVAVRSRLEIWTLPGSRACLAPRWSLTSVPASPPSADLHSPALNRGLSAFASHQLWRRALKHNI
jgi:hypothetical protein